MRSGIALHTGWMERGRPETRHLTWETAHVEWSKKGSCPTSVRRVMLDRPTGERARDRGGRRWLISEAGSSCVWQ